MLAVDIFGGTMNKSDADRYLRTQAGQVAEDVWIEAGFLTNIMHFVHRNDTEKTEADRLGQGDHIRDRKKLKTAEEGRMHISRCKPCQARLKSLLKKLKTAGV